MTHDNFSTSLTVRIMLFALCACATTQYSVCVEPAMNDDYSVSLSQESKNEIIAHALNLVLPLTDTTTPKVVDEISELAFKKVREAKYEQAINITCRGLEKFPKSFLLQSDLASLLGDCSEITSSPLKERMVERSKQLFEKLMRETDGQLKASVYTLKNEYCFRFALYREQYEFGTMRVADYWEKDDWEPSDIRGYYCQGVGAARYARKLLEQGDIPTALEYAQKAIIAWAQYFSYRNNYYNAYVHYALALGILGYKEEMMRALKKSALLINKDLDYFEFKEVIDFIDTSAAYYRGAD